MSRNIDIVIKQFKELATDNRNEQHYWENRPNPNSNTLEYAQKACKRAEENEQLVAWLTELAEYQHAKGDLPHSAASIEAFNKAIAALRAERPKGKWEHILDDTNTQRVVYKCSVCGRIIDTYYREDLAFSYPFCHCGADMRGDKND